MNLAVSQNVKGYGSIGGMPLLSDAYLDESEAITLSSFVQPLSVQNQFTFRSKVTIEGSSVYIPEQRFTLRFSSTQMEIESHSVNDWPNIYLSFTTNKLGNYQIEKARVIESGLSTDAKIKDTRFRCAIAEAGGFSINIPELGPLSITFSPSHEWIEHNRELAKIFRKLRFIEYIFNTRFSIPTQLTSSDIRGIEYLYRGLTEGEFATREESINLLIPKSEINWAAPPFSEPGAFPQKEKWYIVGFFGGMEDILGRHLLVGTTSIRLEKAIYAGQGSIPDYNQPPEESAKVRFEVLDHQIFICYDKYANKGKKKLQERLERFKYQYLRDDPPELLTLMDESLIPDVSVEEANLIAMGWLQYNYLPDRYCSQSPKLDTVNKIWRVPIYLVYASGEGGEVGELQIDIKTGKVISHTPIDTIKAKGKILAEKLMHARETAPVFAGD